MKKIKKIILVVILYAAVQASANQDSFNVRSDSLRLLDRGEQTEFTGSVVMSRDNIRITSDRAVSSRATGMLKASGNVGMDYSSCTVRVTSFCRELDVDQLQKKVTLSKDVKAHIIDSQDQEERAADIYSDILQTDYSGEGVETYFSGNVKMISDEIEISSEKASYSQKNGLVVFSDNPEGKTHNEQHSGWYSGNIIAVSVKDKSMRLEGNAKARIKIYGTKM